MAKLKVTMDARHVSVKTGEASVKIAVAHKSKTAYIPTNVSVKPSQWDEKKGEVIKHESRKRLNDSIDALYSKLKAALREFEEHLNLDAMSANELRDELVEAVNGEKAKVKPMTVKEVFAEFIELKNGRTRDLYACTERKVASYCGNGYDRLRFEHISVNWLLQFDKFLAQTSPSPNARAIHLRNLRAVVNHAVVNDITKDYVFRKFRIKHAPTRKRNLKVETLRTIFNSESLEPWMERYRDLFKLTFMLIGINFVDLCGLQEVCDGRVEYVRAKTHKPYSIKLEPEAAEIIAKYSGNSHLLNYLDTCKSYRHFYNNTCKGLRAIRELLVEKGEAQIDTLTTYWARHSWATIAASLDIPKETIAAALGHSQNSVTDIYIEFDKRKVDEANRRVLNYVLYGWEGGWRPEEAPKKRSV